MKKTITRVTLTQQIIFLAIFSVVLLLIITGVYYVSSSEILAQRSTEYFSIIFRLIESRINEITYVSDSTMQTIASSSSVTKYLREGDKAQTTFVQNLLMETILGTAKKSSSAWDENFIEAIYLLRKGDLVYAESTDLSSIYRSIVEDYRLDKEPFLNTANYTRLYYNPDTDAYYYGIIQPLPFLIYGYPSYSRNIGYCIYLCNANLIQKQIFSTAIPNNAVLYLYDYNHRIVSSSNSDLIGQSLVGILDPNISLNKLSTDAQEITSGGEKLLCRLTNINSTEWRLLLLIPYAGLTSDLTQLFRYGVLLCFLLLSLSFFFDFYVIRRNMKDLRLIVDGLKNIDTLTDHRRLPRNKTVEFDLISQGINKMLMLLEETTEESLKMKDRIYLSEIMKRDAELYALQTQINPHFLYNTLGCICSIAQHYHVKEIELIANSMSKIFRYCIKKESVVPLKDELNCVQDYLKIIKQRFPEQMQFFILVPDELLHYSIPKMTLQPIVENAILHGLRKVNRIGILSISCEETDSLFRIIVKDNGAGIAPEVYEHLLEEGSEESGDGIQEQSKCIGLKNIHSRLQLEYGDSYGLEIFTDFGHSTTVYLNLPRLVAPVLDDCTAASVDNNFSSAWGDMQ